MPVICDPQSFWGEARWQRVCAACRRPGRPFHAHHVVFEQEVRRRLGVRKDDRDPRVFDTRNALRLCNEHGGNCHARFHNGFVVVTTKHLTDDNIAYAFELLGLYGADYLRGKYDDTDPDPRIATKELELEHG